MLERVLLWAPLALTLLAAPAMAEGSGAVLDLAQTRSDLLRVADAGLSGKALTRRLEDLRASFGLEVPPELDAPRIDDIPALGSPQVSSLNLRVAMAKLAIYAGANQQLAVIAAQNGQTDALILQDGSATLDQVVALANAAEADGISRGDDGILLSRPLIVWEGAELVFPDGADLRLASDTGAFVLNFGRLKIGAAHIAATAPITDAPEAFRSFILAAGTGSLQVDGASLTGLGFADAGPYSGLGVVNGGLFRSDDASSISNSTIHDSGPVSLIRTNNSRVVDNHITDGRGVGLYISEAETAVIAGNAITGTRGLQALRVTANSQQILLSGNILAQGDNSGLLIDRNSTDLTFTDNIIALNDAGAIRIQRASCVTIARNLIVANGGPGVGLARVAGAQLSDNIIAFNRAAGLSIADQESDWKTNVSRNLIADNGEGLRGATAGWVRMTENRLDRQFPRLFSGDLGVHTVGYLTARQGAGQRGYLIAPTAEAAQQPDCEGI